MDGTKTRRMDRKDVAQLMGGDGVSGVFTWREKHRRKVAVPLPAALRLSDARPN